MAKRDEVLQAAMACFNTYGYSKTTMSDIGKRVGMNKASLYYHFKDKLALYEAVVNHIRGEHVYNAEREVERQTEITEKIITYVMMEIDFWSNVAVNYLAGSGGVDEAREETYVVFEKIAIEDINKLEGYLKCGIDSGQYNDCETFKMAANILQIPQGLLAVNCPVHLSGEERIAGYRAIKEQTTVILRLMLKGLSK